MSIRRAYSLIRFDPRTYLYKIRRLDQAAIEQRIKEICQTRVRFGCPLTGSRANAIKIQQQMVFLTAGKNECAENAAIRALNATQMQFRSVNQNTGASKTTSLTVPPPNSVMMPSGIVDGVDARVGNSRHRKRNTPLVTCLVNGCRAPGVGLLRNSVDGRRAPFPGRS